MKSILNDVNRLEKAWDLLGRISEVFEKFQQKLDQDQQPAEEMLMLMMALKTAHAFIAKYGDKHEGNHPQSPQEGESR